MSVPYLALSATPGRIRDLWLTEIRDVVSSGVWVGGDRVHEFERAFAAYVGVGECVGVGNGLDALTVGLRALGIGEGSTVAVPGHTFIATWLAVLATGASPIAVDVNECGQLDIAQLERMESPPSAVIPVHMHGAMVDMPRLIAWATQRSVLVLEDCAQAHGMQVAGRMAGSWGDAAAFSFYPTKNLGCLGDGGALATRDPVIAERARSLANYGSSLSDKYVHDRIGVNSRLDAIQAAVLSINLSHLKEWNRRRAQVAAYYLSTLAGSDHLVPLIGRAEDSVWHHFVVRTRDRDTFRKRARALGIGTEVHYPKTAASEVSQVANLDYPDLPNSTALANSVVSLPLTPWMTDSQVESVGNFIESWKGQ